MLDAQEFFGTTEKVYIHQVEVAPTDDNVVYALASIEYFNQGILLVSTDGGDTWAASDSVVDGFSTCLAVDPRDPMTLYVGTSHRGLLRSEDGGANWQAINDGLPSSWYRFFGAVAIDPTNPRRVYLGMNGSVYYSANRGDHWDQVAGPLSAEDSIKRIAIDPQDPRNVYAVVNYGDAYRLLGWDPEGAMSTGETQRLEEGP